MHFGLNDCPGSYNKPSAAWWAATGAGVRARLTVPHSTWQSTWRTAFQAGDECEQYLYSRAILAHLQRPLTLHLFLMEDPLFNPLTSINTQSQRNAKYKMHFKNLLSIQCCFFLLLKKRNLNSDLNIATFPHTVTLYLGNRKIEIPVSCWGSGFFSLGKLY